MASRNELSVRARSVGIDPANYPNDSKLQSKIEYLEQNGTTYTETLGTQVFTTAGADVANGDTINIGNRTYTFKTNLSGVKASSTLTNSVSFADGETVAVRGVTYTFKTTLSNPSNQNEVLIGANVAASLTNLKKAITDAGTIGTHYSVGTVAHPYVTATTLTGTTLLVVAKDFGTEKNTWSTVSNAANATWTGTVLAGGTDNVLDEIKIQASAAVTLDVLKDAINNSAVVGVEGTDYSAGTKAHQQVTATTNTNTAQTVAARNSAFDNAKITTVMTGGGNMAAGGATLASGVRGVVVVDTSTANGSGGLAGAVNHV